MIAVRRSHERGHFNHGWLDTYHTFSFAQYRDPRHVRFRALRVMNEDVVRPGQGFGRHPHDNMEIITYILSGALEHRDSLGNGEQIQAGELQRMSAGVGIEHSEFNPSPTEPVHLYQIWLLPNKQNLTPSYEQKRFSAAEKAGRLRLVAAPDAREGALEIHADAELYLGQLAQDDHLRHVLAPGRHAWLQLLRGEVTVNDQRLTAGDGAAISEAAQLVIDAHQSSEVMLFDLA